MYISSNKYDIDAIIISPTWPSIDSGYGIAVRSSLKLYSNFCSKIYFIGLVDQPFTEMNQWDNDLINWIHIPINKYSKCFRFFRSLFSSYPAVVMKYNSKVIIKQVLKNISLQQKNKRKVVIIFEDIPTAYLLDRIRQKFPRIPVAIRSHNVLTEAFKGFSQKGNFLTRMAWKIEILKIRKYEIDVCKKANKIWAISKEDKLNYWNKLGINCDGVIGVSINANYYATSIKADSIFNIICIGSADLRKGYSLSKFVDTSWIEVLKQIPKAKLILGGRGTQKYTNTNINIKGMGFISDDRDILNKGRIFINTQEYGSGVKLKSIVAMLAGKALISTRIGVEGVEGINGKHFLIADDVKSFAPLIIKLINNKKLAIELGCRARELAIKMYSEERFYKYTEPFLEDFLSRIS